MFTTLFALTAFILMWIGGIRCNFLKFTSTSGADEPFTFEMGMWYYSYYSLLFSTSGTYLFESCNPYVSFLCDMYKIWSYVVLQCSYSINRGFSYLDIIPYFYIIVFINSNWCYLENSPGIWYHYIHFGCSYVGANVCNGLFLHFRLWQATN